jgi:hypothetical protein
MTKEEILEMIAKWRDLTESAQSAYNQADHILSDAHANPCLVCAEALNMIGSANAILGQSAVTFDEGLRAGDIPLDTIPGLMVVSDRLQTIASWHAAAIECVARMSNAAHKQLQTLGIATLGGCTIPHLMVEGQKTTESN